MSWTRALVAALSIGLAGTARGACRVDTTGLPFGLYDFLSPLPLDAFAEIAVSCDAPTSFSVGIAGGDSTPGGHRAMRSASTGALRYVLFHDPALRAPWRDAVHGDLVQGRAAPPGEWRLRLFGRIPPRQAVPPGAYRDELVVTIML